MAPDVLAVQEVGDPSALTELVDLLDGSWHTALANPDHRGIRVGVLSRPALSEVEQFDDFPAQLAPVQVNDAGDTITTAGRPVLRVRFHAGQVPVDVMSCHLKSKLLTFPGGRFQPSNADERARYATYALHRRAAEAATAREHASALLDGHGQQRVLVVAGDLNDEMQAATTQILYGPPGSQIGTGGYSHPDQGDGARLWNLAPLIPAEQRYSRIYHGRRELIDHLLVSHALLDTVQDVSAGGEPDSVADDPRQRIGRPGSDHRIIYADLAIGS